VTAIKRADLAAFDAALDAGEPEFVKRRIYLTLERGRDIALRNLLRKVFIAGGYEPLKEGQSEEDRVRRTRISVAEFTAAVRLSLGQKNGEVLEPDEVECMLANMIYKVSAKIFFCSRYILRGNTAACLGSLMQGIHLPSSFLSPSRSGGHR
jgi:COP9 signalosome complex subunit 12